jgi:hypothetical protein
MKKKCVLSKESLKVLSGAQLSEVRGATDTTLNVALTHTCNG